MDQQPHADDWNARAIPTIPRPRRPRLADDYDTARASQIVRPRRPHTDETDPQ